MGSLNLGPHGVVREVPAPRTYEVTTGTRYLSRLEDGDIRGMADRHTFILDERTGQIMIDGSYGTFAYSWSTSGRAGTSLHAFLHSLDFDYFMKKASKTPHRDHDMPKTLLRMREDVLDARRHDSITKEQARAVWNAVHDLDETMSESEFIAAFQSDNDLYEYWCDGGPPMATKENGAMRAFWDEVWSVFRTEVLAPHADAARREREERRQAA